MGRSTHAFSRAVVCLLAALWLRAAVADPAASGAPGASVQTLEALVAEWVELRSQLADETREWEEKQRHWSTEADLLETEKASLEQELAEANAQVTSAEEKRAGLLEKKEALAQSLEALAPLLDRSEADLRQWIARVPPPLQTKLGKLPAQLPATQSEAEAVPVTRRLQVVIALYTQIETLQHAVHVTPELLPADAGRRRELDVIYIGLARGFAVSSDNLWAAVGMPHDDGWRWTARPALAPAIRQAIAVADRRASAVFVSLPMGVAAPEVGDAP